jgi:hypothetical protein
MGVAVAVAVVVAVVVAVGCSEAAAFITRMVILLEAFI